MVEIRGQKEQAMPKPLEVPKLLILAKRPSTIARILNVIGMVMWNIVTMLLLLIDHLLTCTWLLLQL